MKSKKAKPLKIYHYDRVTMEFIGEGLADENPKDPKNPLVPAFATVIRPNIERLEGNVWCFIENKWINVPDNRGIYYKKETGEIVEISCLGDLSEELTKEPKPTPFHKWDEQAKQWVENKSLVRANEIEERIYGKMAQLMRRAAVDEMIEEGLINPEDKEKALTGKWD